MMTEENEMGTYGLPLILASRWRRLGGALIDAFIAIVFCFLPTVFVLGAMNYSFVPEEMTSRQAATMVILFWGLFLLLNWSLLFNHGQTIGKRVMKIKIVDSSGNIPTFAKLFVLRYLLIPLATLIPGLPVFLCDLVSSVDPLFIFGKERRCLHDYLAGTWVVQVYS
jgi:uncharacterized RDD family membrane protein YckC